MIATTHADAPWNRVTKSRRCPVCEGIDNCESLELEDGFRLVYCGRETNGARKINGGGQGLHLLDPYGRIVPPGEKSSWSNRQLRPDLLPLDHPDFKCRDELNSERLAKEKAKQAKQEEERLETEKRQREIAAAYMLVRKQLSEDGAKVDEENSLDRLSTILGVSVDSLRAVGYLPAKGYDGQRGWAAPEWNADGEIVGLSFRGIDGSKSFVRGGSRGLTMADDWASDLLGGLGPKLVVEGASDVAACRDMGLSAIGRPNNIGGVGENGIGLFLFNELQNLRHIIVVGENDRKEYGRWPGREGALSVAAALRRQLPMANISVAMPPHGVKDIRQYLQTCSPEEIASGVAAERLLEALGANALDDELPERKRRPSQDAKIEPAKCKPACMCDDCLRELADEREVASFTCSFRRAVTGDEVVNGKKAGNAIALVLKLDCETWKCRHCRPKLQKKWSEHTSKLFADCEWIYWRTVPQDHRDAVRKAISRADHGQYVAIDNGDETVTFFSDVQPLGFQQMTPRAAAERFRSQLNVSRCRKRTCSTSKVWRLNEEKEDSHWRLLPGNWNSNAAIRDASEIHDDVECRIIEHPDADVPVRIVFRGWTSPKVFAETVDMLANRGRQDWEDDDGDDVRARLGRLSAEQWRRVLGRTLRPMSALPDMGNGGISGNADTAYGCGPPD